MVRAAYSEWSPDSHDVGQEEADYVLVQALRGCTKARISEDHIRETIGEAIAGVWAGRGTKDQAGFPRYLAQAIRTNASKAHDDEEVARLRLAEQLVTATHKEEGDRRRYDQRGERFEANANHRERRKALNPDTTPEIYDKVVNRLGRSFNETEEYIFDSLAAPLLERLSTGREVRDRPGWAVQLCTEVGFRSYAEIDAAVEHFSGKRWLRPNDGRFQSKMSLPPVAEVLAFVEDFREREYDRRLREDEKLQLTPPHYS